MQHNLADFHISSGVSFEGRFVKQIGTWLLHKAATPSTRVRTPYRPRWLSQTVTVPIVLLSSGFATSPCCCTFFPISI